MKKTMLRNKHWRWLWWSLLNSISQLSNLLTRQPRSKNQKKWKKRYSTRTNNNNNNKSCHVCKTYHRLDQLGTHGGLCWHQMRRQWPFAVLFWCCFFSKMVFRLMAPLADADKETVHKASTTDRRNPNRCLDIKYQLPVFAVWQMCAKILATFKLTNLPACLITIAFTYRRKISFLDFLINSLLIHSSFFFQYSLRKNHILINKRMKMKTLDKYTTDIVTIKTIQHYVILKELINQYLIWWFLFYDQM